ncbi:hypothetical protein P171DRAFT_209872 [Karstenula rhodostoma CBS 690.94]|uniref:Uncharacterized protein n=1 Tax=Karstenula rhodostoma CBS 690.94 TaxID=1392251 RepID=A0A9P4PS78_9PLEO|nr:hypothetical protein P171DRAFT_209872 [Karstenula rhodostoma CBS 690.94]
MSHLATSSASPCERNANRKRKDSGAAGSDHSQRRVRTKISTNGDVIRVLCPFFIKSPHEPCKAHSCRMTGFSEVAKIRDHLKDVHNLSKDILDKLNFKSGRFRSLKTLEEKWKLAFIILFPEVPKDEIPSPLRHEIQAPFGIDHNNISEKCSAAPFNNTEFITRDGGIGHDLLDVFAARIQNWVFDRLSVEAKVPIEIKLDIISDFPLALRRIIAGIADPDMPSGCKSTPDKVTSNSLQDLDLDFNLSAT